MRPPLSQRLSQQDELVDEEICPGYELKKYYPAEPGQLLDNRYQILVKVGWGSSSTTWFARDMRGYRWEPEKLVALKIINAKSPTIASEREVEEHIAKADPSHRGYTLLRTHLEAFEFLSQERRHLCLAYEPMREPLWIYQRRFKDGIIPIPLIKAYIRFLLAGLDYLHTTCGIVHTVNYGFHPIQPGHYRAPEVILGCGWNTSADIWNLGVLLWNLIEGKELFQKVYDAEGHYVAKTHLAEMIGLLGSPPRELVAKVNSSLLNPWPEPIEGEGGIMCNNANEYYGGPFFDNDGM
ncbi:protein kinase [Penicillium sp. DV-2018c]|nr:protein kinase [Penicillium sp. DV-2018c]